VTDFSSYTDEALDETLDAIHFERSVRGAMRPRRCMTFAALNAIWWGEPCHLPAGHDSDHDFGTPEEIKARREAYDKADAERHTAVAVEVERRRGATP
jgi:hypothetical protein